VRFAKPTQCPAIRFLFVLAASVLLGSCSHPGQSALAITHVTLIDATGSAPQPDTTVLIADHRIASVGPAKTIRIPRDTQVFDGAGKFLIPGLADMHVHLTGSSEPAGSREFILPLLIANGITTMRDMGGYLESLIPLRHDIEGGKRVGPQIFFAGPYLDGSPPSFQPSLVVTNSVEAAEDVHQLVAQGVDFIKVQSVLSREAYFAIARSCRQEHITFVGHVPDAVTAAEASDAGQKSIEHLTGVLRACAKDEPHLMREQLRNGGRKETLARARARELTVERELLQTYSGTKAAELMEKFVRNRTWQVPTLILLRNLAYATPQIDRSDNLAARYVPHKILEQWLAVRHEQNEGATSQEFVLRAALLQRSIQLVGTMQASGVSIMAGTDTGAPYVFPGFALHNELALLVQAGLTPMQALQAATKSPADFLGKTKTQGTVEPGKFADLLLLDANPLDDIRNTKKIRAVVLRGKLLDRNDLDALLAAEEKFAGSN
jgi:imidazolonepropionase-like amidohydrolase